jgi:hypothetical protein
VSERWDRDALTAGATVTAVFAAPFAIVGRIALDTEWSDTVVVLCNLGMIAGLVLGAGVSAWRQQRGTPLSHGIVVALATYAVIQAVLVIVRVLRGEGADVAAVVFNTAFALGAGLVGGLLGQMLLSRGLAPPDRPSSRP